jgi:hypothetical protein
LKPIRWCLLQIDDRPLTFFYDSKKLKYNDREDSVKMMRNLNNDSMIQKWDYWSMSALINQLKCSMMNCDYKWLGITPQHHQGRHLIWGKIIVLWNFLLKNQDVDIVAYLDSDAFVRDEERLEMLVNILANNPDKHGILSRDPLMQKNTYINAGCMILKNNDYVVNLMKQTWNGAFNNRKYLWDWPCEQFFLSDLIESDKESFYICKTAVLNTPCGEIVRHSWHKEMLEDLIADELRATIANMVAGGKRAGRQADEFNIDTLLD